MELKKKKYILILASSIVSLLVGIFFVYIGNHIRDINPESILAPIFEFSIFLFGAISLVIIFSNIKFIKEYDNESRRLKGIKRVESGESTIIKDIETMFGNSKKFSFLIPIGAFIMLIVLLIIPSNLDFVNLDPVYFLYPLFMLAVVTYSSVSIYKNYKRKIHFLDKYSNDQKGLIKEVYKLKSKHDSSLFNQANPPISIYDTMLMNLGEDIIPVQDAEKVFLKHIKKAYGLYKYSGLFILLIPHVFGLIFVVFSESENVFNDGSFWFNYIGLIVIFTAIFFWFKHNQKEGKYILENYKYNTKEVVEYLEDKRTLLLGSTVGKGRKPIDTSKYDQTLLLLDRINKDLKLFDNEQ